MNNLIYRVEGGELIEKRSSRLCVFASFSVDGHVEPHVVVYLRSLHELGFDIVFVQCSDQPADENCYFQLKPLCRKIINRRNVGYDFFSWKEGMQTIPDILEYENLLLTNDSIIGPFTPLKPIIDKMDEDPTSLWALTDCRETGTYHIQSYFIYCHRQVFSKRFFGRFWRDLKILHQKWQIVLRHEVGFSKAATAAGVPLKAFISYSDIKKRCIARGKKFQFWHEIGKEPLNPTLFAWDILLEEMKFPFIKSELLRGNRLKLKSIHQWPSKVANSPRDLVDAALKYELSCQWAISKRYLSREDVSAVHVKTSGPGLAHKLYVRFDHRRDQAKRLVRDLRSGNSDEIIRKLSKIKLLGLLLSKVKRARANNLLQATPRERYFTEARQELGLFLASGKQIRIPKSANPKVTVILILYNKAELTLRCLRSLEALKGEPFQLLIIDNASSDETPKLTGKIKGATVVRNEENVGFLRACNQAARLVTTEHILFLNNDTIVYPGSIKVGIDVLADKSVGAVGGRVILPDGTLQEAGNIFWNDGTCVGFGRGLPKDADVCMHQRAVDYCSGVFLMTPTDLFRDIGGFDEIFAPAYYEESDYCAQIQSRGLKIVYDPRISLTHVEFGSSEVTSSAFDLMTRNREKFLDKNRDLLLTKSAPGTDHHLVSSLRFGRRKWLFLDDRVALPHIGAGYPRMNRIIHLIAEQEDFEVTVACTENFVGDWTEIRRNIPIEIEVLNLTDAARRESFLKERLTDFDVVWVSRPSNMEYIAKNIPAIDLSNRAYTLIYDSEAIFADRAVAEAEVFGLPTDYAINLRHTELSNGCLADIIVAVCDVDAQQWRSKTTRPVIVVGHDAPVVPGPRNFKARKDILFIGSLHGVLSPNADSLFWFMGEVMPLILTNIPDVTLRAVGFVDGGLKSQIGGGRRGFELVGGVPDLKPYLEDHRMVVVPTRFAAGIPQKVFDAAVTGIPTVCSPLIASQMGWQDGVETLIGDIKNPKHFAEQCVRLYTDEMLWNQVYQGSLDSMQSYAKVHSIKRGVEQVLTEVQNHKKLKGEHSEPAQVKNVLNI